MLLGTAKGGLVVVVVCVCVGDTLSYLACTAPGRR